MSEGLRELMARELEPQAWSALGVGDTLAYKHRRTSSLRKADRLLAAIEAAGFVPMPVELTMEMRRAGAILREIDKPIGEVYQAMLSARPKL